MNTEGNYIYMVIAVIITGLAVGHYIRGGFRAPVEVAPLTPVVHRDRTPPVPTPVPFSISSSAFTNDGFIPEKYTCDVPTPVTPPISFVGVPKDAKSLVLLMDDPDLPASIKAKLGRDKYDHWAVYGIPSDVKEMAEGAMLGSLGLNSGAKAEYQPPCPPKNLSPTEHRYHIRAYALAGMINFKTAPTFDELENLAKGSALASAELVGRYSRK